MRDAFKKTSLFFLTVFILTASAAVARAENKIVAVVNDDAISEMDLAQRRKLLVLLARDKARNASKISQDDLLDQLIDEKLKQQEIARTGTSISARELEETIKQAIRQNGYSDVELKKTLTKNGVPFAILENQIKNDFLFLRAVRKNAGHRADISDVEIDARLNEIKNKLTTKQYLLSEIVIPVKNEQDDAAAYGRAMQVLIALREGKPFPELAKKNSSGPSAAKGGLLGWIPENMLAPTVKDELALMDIGEVSTPVKTPQGYKIVALHNMQNPKSMEKQDAFELMQVFLPATMDNADKKQTMTRLRNTNGSCSDFTTVAVELNTTPRIDLGTVVVSEIPTEILSRIRKAGVLKITEPMPIDSGELVFMACRQTTTTPLPDKNRIRMQIENERIETIAQRYLRDLRRKAIVEKR